MSFKGVFLAASGIVFSIIVIFIVVSLKHAAVEAEASNRVVRAESNCASQVEQAIVIVKRIAREQGIESRVTDTANHYNHQLQKCLVAVTTFEHRETSVTVKTLLIPSEQTTLLWSLKESLANSNQSCFGPSLTPLDCAETERRWKLFMTE